MRRTIRERRSVGGVGLHYGTDCELVLAPAPPNSGVIFRRVDLPGRPETRAHVAAAVLSERRTQLGEGEGALHTVEHVLAAVAGAGLDDVMIEMNAAEPPICDGSAAPFFAAIEDAGIIEQAGAPDVLDLTETVRVVDGDSVYVAHPATGFDLHVAIDYPHPVIGAQAGEWRLDRTTFANELARARTFGFVHEVAALRAKGLIKGASTSNAIVLDEHGVIDTTLRWPDEFLRHKAMDCVGDLALTGCRIINARISAHKPSHRGTVTLVRAMLDHAKPTVAHPEARVIEIDEIMKVIPHRYPFLLVDRVLEIEERKRIVGIKNVTVNEPFFQGHFPGHPIMPGVLIVEAMAQVGGMLLMGSVDDPASKVVYFMSLDNVKFRKPVKPGDQLRFELEMKKIRGPVCQMAGVAKVDGAIVCEAEMAAMVRDR
ncbi:MAG: bifunctional UDP-3-O-[3-hydroxymyristoyl] N-acetylglucosamine deacetylase/3-hydroxyacyl-ACP dehydratase [Gemmatimonadetes bacterium]|nr:bifunctional UDP-3-O-[3-hydroxymyristoyl] N-acetylglucosamine deacetylase/3-hydroxyacyl-ACP dehydratase [Gemmatimonadota bacterium]